MALSFEEEFELFKKKESSPISETGGIPLEEPTIPQVVPPAPVATPPVAEPIAPQELPPAPGVPVTTPPVEETVVPQGISPGPGASTEDVIDIPVKEELIDFEAEFNVLKSRVNPDEPGLFERLGSSISEAFTGASRQTPETRITPEISSLGAFTAGGVFKDLQIAAGLLIAFDEEQQIDIIKSVIPDAVISRDAEQNVFIDFAGQRVLLNRPRFSFADAMQFIVQTAAFLPAAKFAQLGITLLQRVVRGAVAAALTSAGLDIAVVPLGSRQAVNPERAITSAVLGGAGEVVSNFFGRIFKGDRAAREAKALGVSKGALTDTKTAIKEADEVVEALEKATGVRVGLTVPQRTLDPVQQAQQVALQKLPTSEKRAFNFLRIQNEEALSATMKIVDAVAPPEALSTGALKVKSAAEKAIEAQKLIRKEAASPIYKQAFRRQRQGKVGKIDLDNWTNKNEGILKQLDPEDEIVTTLKPIMARAKRAKGDLKLLHDTKIQFDRVINARGADSVGATTKRQLVFAQEDLVQELSKQSPSYNAAREAFIRETPAIKALQDSQIGQLAKLKGTELKRAVKLIFDAGETDPKTLTRIKSILEKSNPEAWKEAQRINFQSKIGDITLDRPGVKPENVPSQLLKALFSPKSKRLLLAAADNKGKQNLINLEKVLKRGSEARLTGSQPPGVGRALQAIEGNAATAIASFFSGLIKSPIFAASAVARGTKIRGFAERRTKVLADLLFDKRWDHKARLLNSLKPDSPSAFSRWSQTLRDIELEVFREEIEDQNVEQR